MKIVVFGAGGRTGRLLVERLLESGHEVTAAARNPEGIQMDATHLRRVRWDVLDARATQEAVAGQECVFFVVGPAKALGPTTVFSDGIRNVLAAARIAGVRRIIVLSSSGIDDGKNIRLHMHLLERFVVRPLLFGLYVDLARMEGILEASETDWTLVRPPRLTNGPATSDYRSAVGGHLPGIASISRADLADAMIKTIGNPGSHRTWIEVDGNR